MAPQPKAKTKATAKTTVTTAGKTTGKAQTTAKASAKGWTKAKVATIDEYLAALSDDKRAALEKLRQTIRRAAPGAEEVISYRLPAFRLNGMLVAFGATANHCAFFPMSGSMVATFKDDLKDFDTSKGTIRFQPDKPLPVSLVRKIVKARIAENAE
jgi:uncharacterized protein YdhG (YjbR/CyaY superfamily)